MITIKTPTGLEVSVGLECEFRAVFETLSSSALNPIIASSSGQACPSSELIQTSPWSAECGPTPTHVASNHDLQLKAIEDVLAGRVTNIAEVAPEHRSQALITAANLHRAYERNGTIIREYFDALTETREELGQTREDLVSYQNAKLNPWQLIKLQGLVEFEKEVMDLAQRHDWIPGSGYTALAWIANKLLLNSVSKQPEDALTEAYMTQDHTRLNDEVEKLREENAQLKHGLEALRQTAAERRTSYVNLVEENQRISEKHDKLALKYDKLLERLGEQNML